MYTDVFPFLGTGDDENRLLAKTSVIQVNILLKEVFLSSFFYFPVKTSSSTNRIFGSTLLFQNYSCHCTFTTPNECSAVHSSDIIHPIASNQGVTKATTAWVEDFVLKYKLCPFAEHVFVTGGIRYR